MSWLSDLFGTLSGAGLPGLPGGLGSAGGGLLPSPQPPAPDPLGGLGAARVQTQPLGSIFGPTPDWGGVVNLSGQGFGINGATPGAPDPNVVNLSGRGFGINGTQVPQTSPAQPSAPAPAPAPHQTPSPYEITPWHAPIQMGGYGTGIFGSKFGVPGAPTGKAMFNKVPGTGQAAGTMPGPTSPPTQFSSTPMTTPRMQAQVPWMRGGT